ncbi:MAG: dienelactone hydrolase family protein [Pseudomonadota bacterium]
MTSTVAAGGRVTFPGKSAEDTTLTLRGLLTRPVGDGKMPAVVLLHGGGGMAEDRDAQWTQRLVAWGYVVLQVDSFRPRGQTVIGHDLRSIHPHTRGRDAHAGKSYLASLPFVDASRIGVLGWGHGGWSAIYAVSRDWRDGDAPPRKAPFRAAVAFYPFCQSRLVALDAPLLILIGELDDWALATRCERMRTENGSAHQVGLKVYPGAHHNFDWVGINRHEAGHRLQYDPAATTDSVEQVREFMARHLR